MSSKAHGYRHLVRSDGGVWVGVHTSREGALQEKVGLRGLGLEVYNLVAPPVPCICVFLNLFRCEQALTTAIASNSQLDLP